MKTKLIFILSFVGLLAALLSAYIYNLPHHAQPPVYQPASNPFVKGIYANGIIESDQSSGSNMNVYPEVSGTLRTISVHEGQQVKKDAPLFMIDTSIQSTNVLVAEAQLSIAQATLKTATDEYDKQKAVYDINPDYVTRDTIDNDLNAVKVATANVALTRKQYELNQVMLSKYTVLAPDSGIVIAINASVGDYLSPQGVYDTYTQGNDPVVVLGTPQHAMAVRVYIDEILVPQLPPAQKITAQMSIRGSDVRITLQFIRMQPYVTPKINLSDERQERVDVRVLPLLFRFTPDPSHPLYPGQMVDVYIKQQ